MLFQAMIEEHVKLHNTIKSAPIDELDAQGQRLLKRINGNHCDADSGFSGEISCSPLQYLALCDFNKIFSFNVTPVNDFK